MMTNPASSLASVQQSLNEFSLASYYEVNASKSHILPLGLLNDMHTTLEKTNIPTGGLRIPFPT